MLTASTNLQDYSSFEQIDRSWILYLGQFFITLYYLLIKVSL